MRHSQVGQTLQDDKGFKQAQQITTQLKHLNKINAVSVRLSVETMATTASGLLMENKDTMIERHFSDGEQTHISA